VKKRMTKARRETINRPSREAMKTKTGAPKKNTMAGLKPLRGAVVKGQKIRLREKKLTDVRSDYRWQSDAELSRLDAAPPLKMPFALYILDYASFIHVNNGFRLPLAVETMEGRHIGNCTAYDIDEKHGEAQIGIMIGDKDYWSQGYGTDIINTLVSHIYNRSTLGRLYLKTLVWNIRAQKCFMKCGFTECGRLKKDGYDFMLMELKRDKWEKRQNSEPR
jgi:RimJ/RimL family protein N-acetyltransferase